MHSKKMIALLLALVMVLSLAACGGKETSVAEVVPADARDTVIIAIGDEPTTLDPTNWIIDLVMDVPHMVLIMLISVAFGRGLKGLLIGVAATTGSQFFVGLVLMFPHAILHEAAISFLGYGLPPDRAAIGIILAESMNYLSAGLWWPLPFWASSPAMPL